MQLLVADTSIFIDFFRRSSRAHAVFIDALSQNQVYLSVFVRLELLQGVAAADREGLIQALGGLKPLNASPALFSLAETLLPIVQQTGLTSGLVDLLIACQALERGIPLLTRDKVMTKVARAIGVKIV